MVKFVEYLQLSFLMAFLQSWPFQGVHDGIDAGSLAMLV